MNFKCKNVGASAFEKIKNVAFLSKMLRFSKMLSGFGVYARQWCVLAVRGTSLPLDAWMAGKLRNANRGLSIPLLSVMRYIKLLYKCIKTPRCTELQVSAQIAAAHNTRTFTTLLG